MEQDLSACLSDWGIGRIETDTYYPLGLPYWLEMRAVHLAIKRSPTFDPGLVLPLQDIAIVRT
jgi:hypothetical protein